MWVVRAKVVLRGSQQTSQNEAGEDRVHGYGDRRDLLSPMMFGLRTAWPHLPESGLYCRPACRYLACWGWPSCWSNSCSPAVGGGGVMCGAANSTPSL